MVLISLLSPLSPVQEFGIALSLNETRITEYNIKVGTRPYMAPERYELRSAPTFALDTYSLGIVFFEMLTGELPSESPEQKLRDREMPPELVELVMRCLDADPKRRYANAGELVAALEKALPAAVEEDKSGGLVPLDTRDETAPKRAGRFAWFSRKRVVAGIAAALIAAVSCILFFTRFNSDVERGAELIPDEPIAVASASLGEIPSGECGDPVEAPEQSEQVQAGPSAVQEEGEHISGANEIAEETARPKGDDAPGPAINAEHVRVRKNSSQPLAENANRVLERTGARSARPAKAHSQAPARKVTEGGTMSPDDYLELAALAYAVNDIERTERILKEALERSPDETGMLLLLGWLLVETDRLDEAMALWDSASEEINQNDAYIVSARRYARNLMSSALLAEISAADASH